MEGDKYVLGYWAIRGRGQVIRLLLSYTGLEWEDKVYSGPEKWFGSGDKYKLDLDFPNLPYLIKGDFKLTESVAIAKYVIQKSKKQDLLGKTPEDQARVEMLVSLMDDIFNPTMALFFSPNYSTESNRLFDGKIKEKLDLISKYIGEKDTCLEYLTLADFKLAEASFYFEKLYHEQYPKYEAISRIRKTIMNLPEVKKYYEQ